MCQFFQLIVEVIISFICLPLMAFKVGSVNTVTHLKCSGKVGWGKGPQTSLWQVEDHLCDLGKSGFNELQAESKA